MLVVYVWYCLHTAPRSICALFTEILFQGCAYCLQTLMWFARSMFIHLAEQYLVDWQSEQTPEAGALHIEQVDKWGWLNKGWTLSSG